MVAVAAFLTPIAGPAAADTPGASGEVRAAVAAAAYPWTLQEGEQGSWTNPNVGTSQARVGTSFVREQNPEWNCQLTWYLGDTVVGRGDRYTPIAADLGKRLVVKEERCFEDIIQGFYLYTAFPAILPGQFTAAPTPTISGTVQVGKALTAAPGTWSPTAILSYQWLRDGVAISGATGSTYTVVAADGAKKLSVRVSAARTGWTTTTRTSVQTAAVVQVFGTAPTPTITGTPNLGTKLTASTGTWSPAPTLAYQWRRDGVAISGATKSTYTSVLADEGKKVTVTVTATRSGYVATARTSAAVTIVALKGVAQSPFG